MRKELSKKELEEKSVFYQLRYKANMNQDELAKRVSKYRACDRGRISNIERGEVSNIYLEEYIAYSKIFGVSVDYLLGLSVNKKGFNADIISCADFLGVSRSTVENILELTKNHSKIINDEDICLTNEEVELNDYWMTCGSFIFDLFFSSTDVSLRIRLHGFLYFIYAILKAYIENHEQRDVGDYLGSWSKYKGIAFDLCDELFETLEIIDIDELRSEVKLYDTKNQTNIFSDLFDGVADPGDN